MFNFETGAYLAGVIFGTMLTVKLFQTGLGLVVSKIKPLNNIRDQANNGNGGAKKEHIDILQHEFDENKHILGQIKDRQIVNETYTKQCFKGLEKTQDKNAALLAKQTEAVIRSAEYLKDIRNTLTRKGKL